MPHGDDSTWIQTFTGKQFWPLDPRPEDICIEDIAHALAMKCRYTGHTRCFYSVAQHSVIVSTCVPPQDGLWGLLHDAAEAYMPDVARPVKQALPELKAMDARITRCVAEHFGISLPIPESVHRADLILLATERRDLMPNPPRPWRSVEGVQPLDKIITRGVGPESAREMFHDYFQHHYQNRPTHKPPSST